MAERIPLPARGEQGTGLRLASLFLAEQRSGRMKAVLNWYCWLIRGGKMQSTYPLLECSSMAEQPTVNRRVIGWNPIIPAKG